MKQNKRRTKALLEHEAYLKKLGVKGKGKHSSVNSIPSYTTRSNAELSNKVAGNGTSVDKPKYTGNYIRGVAVSHKSNLIPITSKQQAIDVSQMRRN